MAKKSFTCINTVVNNHVYYNPGDTIEMDADEGRALVEAGVLEDLNPDRKAAFEESQKPPAPYKEDLTQLKGVGRETEAMINNMGITNFQGLAQASVDTLAQVPGLSDRKAKDIIKQAAKLAKKYKK